MNKWWKLLCGFFVLLFILQACSPKITASVRMIGNSSCSLTIGAWVFRTYCRKGVWQRFGH